MRPSKGRGHADRFVRVLLRMRRLQGSAKAQDRRLLRILFIRLSRELPAKGCRRTLLLTNAVMRKNIKWIIAAVAIAAFAALTAYQLTGGREYSSDLASLRAEFNRDKGKPRLLVLLSPT